MIPVIMSGGSGTRLWPLSRKHKPKQFLALFGENTMFQEALNRSDDAFFINTFAFKTNRDTQLFC